MTVRSDSMVLPFLSFLVIFLLLISLYYYYYHIKLYLYLKKYRIDLLNYVSGGDLVGFDKIRKAFQRSKNWHFGDVGEEDETIKYYKKRLKISAKISYILHILILLPRFSFGTFSSITSKQVHVGHRKEHVPHPIQISLTSFHI